MNTLRSGLLALALAVPTLAQAAHRAPPPAAPAIPVIDPARLAIAQQIVAITLPPERGEAMASQMMDAFAKPMVAQMSTAFHNDPGLMQLVNEFMGEVTQISRESTHDTLPVMRDAVAKAYARQYSSDELTQILAFGQTPTGAKYLSHAADLMQDKNVQATMTQSMTETQTRLKPVLESFKGKVGAYMTAHPEIAKKLASAQR